MYLQKKALEICVDETQRELTTMRSERDEAMRNSDAIKSQYTNYQVLKFNSGIHTNNDRQINCLFFDFTLDVKIILLLTSLGNKVNFLKSLKKNCIKNILTFHPCIF